LGASRLNQISHAPNNRIIQDKGETIIPWDIATDINAAPILIIPAA
jgi:hypothetical protein